MAKGQRLEQRDVESSLLLPPARPAYLSAVLPPGACSPLGEYQGKDFGMCNGQQSSVGLHNKYYTKSG
jgi:hypothetical protein